MDSSNLEDLRLPLTIVTRLIREAIPPGVNVSKEAKTAIARSAAIFIVHATTYANEYAVAHKRKNVTAADVFHAVKILECDELEKPLAEAMESFKMLRDQRNEQRRQRRSNAAANKKDGNSQETPDADGVGETNSNNENVEEDDE